MVLSLNLFIFIMFFLWGATCIIFSVMDMGFHIQNNVFELPNGYIFVDIFMFTCILFELPKPLFSCLYLLILFDCICAEQRPYFGVSNLIYILFYF